MTANKSPLARPTAPGRLASLLGLAGRLGPAGQAPPTRLLGLAGPLGLAGLLALALSLLALGCLKLGPVGPAPKPFNAPMDRWLIQGVPFYPDDTILCGPASMAEVMTFLGRPTTVAEATTPLLRANLRGSLAPDLVIWARREGFKARFWAAAPEEIVSLIKANQPVILQIDSGQAITTGHFVVALGYGPEGLVVNSANVKQEILPWAEFLTRWFKFKNLAILLENPAKPSPSEAAKPTEAAPLAPPIILDQPL